MEERKEYHLLGTYLKRKYYISTMYRKASTIEEIWYFETIVFEWNSETRKTGAIVEMEDSGMDEEQAFDGHIYLVKKMNDLLK